MLNVASAAQPILITDATETTKQFQRSNQVRDYPTDKFSLAELVEKLLNSSLGHQAEATMLSGLTVRLRVGSDDKGSRYYDLTVSDVARETAQRKPAPRELLDYSSMKPRGKMEVDLEELGL